MDGPLPEDLHELLDRLADRLGALRKGGERDLDVARTFLVRAFREGKLGRITLDDLTESGRSDETATLTHDEQVEETVTRYMEGVTRRAEDNERERAEGQQAKTQAEASRTMRMASAPRTGRRWSGGTRARGQQKRKTRKR